jgi:hypothetical protein
MTGKDPLLNRRITSIFINELSNLTPLIDNPQVQTLPNLEFTIHKIRPSLVIFEMEALYKEYETLIDLVKNEAEINLINEKKQLLLDHIEENLERLKQFINGLG